MKKKTKMTTVSKTEKTSNTIDKLILKDHEPLKKLIKVMKDEKSSLEKQKEAFNQFMPLLLVHAKAEEEAFYTVLKNDGEFRKQSFEAEVEHSLAEQMCGEAQIDEDDDMIAAKIKVLAELVEHHIKEEEEDLLPDVKKCFDVETLSEIGAKYLQSKHQHEADLGETDDDDTDASPKKKIEPEKPAYGAAVEYIS